MISLFSRILRGIEWNNSMVEFERRHSFEKVYNIEDVRESRCSSEIQPRRGWHNFCRHRRESDIDFQREAKKHETR